MESAVLFIFISLTALAGFLFARHSMRVNFRFLLGVLSLVTRREPLEFLAQAAQKRAAFSYERVLRYKSISLLGAAAVLLLGWRTLTLAEGVVLGAGFLFLALQWPELYLKQCIVRRRRALARGFPTAIDLVRIYVSSGKSLEQAVAMAGCRLAGAWGDFFQSLSFRLHSGASLSHALESAGRLGASAELRRFAAVLTQTRQLGVPIIATLALESELARSRRRREAETRARAASVKIALPLVLCIFPALLIIYLAPAVLKIWHGL